MQACTSGLMKKFKAEPILQAGRSGVRCWRGSIVGVQIVEMTGDQKFEIYWRGRPIGMVWKAGALWFADRDGMANPKVCDVSREAAVDSLINRLAEAHSRETRQTSHVRT
jgi:hypothetical protein